MHKVFLIKFFGDEDTMKMARREVETSLTAKFKQIIITENTWVLQENFINIHK